MYCMAVRELSLHVHPWIALRVCLQDEHSSSGTHATAQGRASVTLYQSGPLPAVTIACRWCTQGRCIQYRPTQYTRDSLAGSPRRQVAER